MSDKFAELTVDEGTELLWRKPVTIEGLEARYEKWRWDGMVGESVVFLSEDVAGMERERIIEMVCGHFECDHSGTTFTRGDTFTFVNFNFRD